MHTDLRTARERRKWSQVALARKSGVDQTTISRIEAAETTNPSNATVQKLEQALQLKRGTLVFGEPAAEAQAS